MEKESPYYLEEEKEITVWVRKKTRAKLSKLKKRYKLPYWQIIDVGIDLWKKEKELEKTD